MNLLDTGNVVTSQYSNMHYKRLPNWPSKIIAVVRRRASLACGVPYRDSGPSSTLSDATTSGVLQAQITADNMVPLVAVHSIDCLIDKRQYCGRKGRSWPHFCQPNMPHPCFRPPSMRNVHYNVNNITLTESEAGYAPVVRYAMDMYMRSGEGTSP